MTYNNVQTHNFTGKRIKNFIWLKIIFQDVTRTAVNPVNF